jgi:hypothetical protein
MLAVIFGDFPGGDPKKEPETVLDRYRAIDGTFCFPSSV